MSPAAVFSQDWLEFPVPFFLETEEFDGTDLTVGDFNADGLLDLATVHSFSEKVIVFLNDGNIGFVEGQNVDNVGTSPVGIITADIGGDGDLDLVTVNKDSNDVTLLFGSGSGTFGVGATVAVGSEPTVLETGDFNDDDFPDIAVVNSASEDLTILLNNGDATFAASTGPSGLSFVETLKASDFDGDGIIDLITENFLYLGNGNQGSGDGTFSSGIALSGLSDDFAIADFNEDGLPDVVAVNPSSGADFNLLLNSGNGTFASQTGLNAQDF